MLIMAKQAARNLALVFFGEKHTHVVISSAGGVRHGAGEITYLTLCIKKMVLASQLTHKIVNLLFYLVMIKTQVDFVGGLTF